jgi:hypothetical protein
MDDVEVWSVANDGSWIEVWGGAPRRLDVRRRALVSTIDQRIVMLPPSWHEYMMEALYSDDGSTAIGFDDVPGQEYTKALWRVDLRAESPAISRTTFMVKPRTAVELSSDGSRTAFVENGTLSVYELESEQLVAAYRLPARFAGATMVFLENDLLRFYSRNGDDSDITIRIGEFRVAENRFEETGRIDDLLGPMWMALSSSGKNMIVGLPSSEAGERIRVLYDAVDGARIREIGRRGVSRFLADGRVLSILRGPEGSRVIVESVDGLARVEHDLGRADWEGLGGEALPGKMVVMRLYSLGDRTDGRSCELVDVDSGETRTLASGIRRVHDGYQWLHGGRLMVRWYKSSPEANRIFTDSGGAVVRWEPDTGEMVHVVGGRRD